MHTHKLQRINPLAVSDPALMFGKVNSSSDFEDGIFTAYFRKANKAHSVHKMTTWICLDAPLHQGWAEFLSSALDKGEVLTCSLYSGEESVVTFLQGISQMQLWWSIHLGPSTCIQIF